MSNNVKSFLPILFVLSIMLQGQGGAAVSVPPAAASLKPVIFDDAVASIHIKARQWLPAKLYAAPRIDHAITSRSKRTFRNLSVITSVPVLGFAGLLGIASVILFCVTSAARIHKGAWVKEWLDTDSPDMMMPISGAMAAMLVFATGWVMLCKTTLGPNHKLAQANSGQPAQKK
jgi:hypothetical protein